MHKLPQSLQDKNNFGWSLQVYSGDRRLICIINASHAWLLCLGITFGLLSGLMFKEIMPEVTTAPTDSEINSALTMPIGID
ncbi:hypothetical protein [Picosynechococcus sp. PCC 7003]|uniref:hypothetical protein n=1 Tax=Picosynechococcus sp. PCC 7003 TaxID=374981 RepID=UPI0012ED64A8|nr:hypothetical protein [Picosynechococcus sp. PCC 7003]